MQIEKINEFLDQNVDDKKLAEREDYDDMKKGKEKEEINFTGGPAGMRGLFINPKSKTPYELPYYRLSNQRRKHSNC